MKARHLTFSVVMAAVGLATLPACNTIDDASEAYGQQTQNLNATGGTVWIFESEDPESGIWPAAIYAEGDPSTRIPVTRQTLGDHLEPGDTLLLPGGIYRHPFNGDNATFYNIQGTEADPITVTSYPGETAIFDPGYPEFRSPGAWQPATSADVASGQPHPDEWVSTATYGVCPDDPTEAGAGCCAVGCTYERKHTKNEEQRLWGQMLDRKQRLMTYTNFEDMRADNESLARAPLADPRSGFGPLKRHPTKKILHTYFGPGVRYNSDTGRIHIRMSHTHMNTPGIEDYTGSTNPNDHALSIAERGARAAVVNTCNNVIFEDIVFQNGGGQSTLEIRNAAITLSRSVVYGSYSGIAINNSELRGSEEGVLITNSVLDGALAPWTTRSEIKNEYFYFGQEDNEYLCNQNGGKWVDERCEKKTGAARSTNAGLMGVQGGANIEVAHSELRNSHDGLILSRGSLRFHHNLIENVQDEAFQVWRTPDESDALYIHENMFRQVLHPLSLKMKGVNAPVYFYRNVVDQRIPFRAHRVFSPDAPNSVVWKTGDDFKMNIDEQNPNGPLYVYHNTFLGARRHGGTQSLIFSNIHPTDWHDRWFFNNIHMTFEREAPFIDVPPPDAHHRSDGNVWYSETHDASSQPAYRGALVAGFDASSQFVDPQLRNLSSELFDYGVPFDEDGVYYYPNNDFRPAPQSPAIGGGVQLPEDPQNLGHPLPDILAVSSNPDVGALPANANPLVVGIDGGHRFPEVGVPVADAGQHQTVVDVDRDGRKLVTLDASGSVDADGTIVSYSWSVAGSSLYVPLTRELTIPEGVTHLDVGFQLGTGEGDAYLDAVSVKRSGDEQNLLVNPSFEEDFTGWSSNGGLDLISTHTHHGERAVVGEGGRYRYLLQRVEVTAGETYRLSAFVRTVDRTAPVRFRAWMSGPGRPTTNHTVDEVSGTTMAANGVEPQILLPVGNHTVLLEVTDPDGNVDTDTVFVRFETTPEAKGNLLVDGGFEEHDRYSIAKNNAWRFINGGDIDHLVSYSGGKSVSMHGTSLTQSIRQAVTIDPDRRYVLSGQVKTQGLTPDLEAAAASDVGAYIRVNAVGAAGGDGGRVYVSPEKFQHTTDGFVPFEIELNPSSITVAYNIWLMLDKGTVGTVWFDDLVLREVNRIEDGGFEQGGLGWRFHKGADVLNADAAQGLASLVLTGYQDARQWVDVTPGETVTVSGWVRTDALDKKPLIRLGNITVAHIPAGSSDYTYFEGDIDVPEDVTTMELMLTLQGGETGSANFDYLHIE